MRRILTATALGALCVGASPAPSQASCEEPSTQLEMNMCARQEYEAADKDLNAAYKKAMAGLEKGHKSALQKAQRAWITYRDLACESFSLHAEGGSMQAWLVNSCRAGLTKDRTKMLIEQGKTY